MTRVEICLSTLAGARAAEAEGADRIELCARLDVGGTTPGVDLVREVLRSGLAVDVQVMIRPRGGDFVWSRDELTMMLETIVEMRARAARAGRGLGFVVGALTAGSQVDVPATRALVDACAGAPTTFHKAIDSTPDVERSLDVLMHLGVTRVLTSGGAADAVSGIPTLRRMVQQADGDTVVMAGGSIRAHNVVRVVQETGVPEVHLLASGTGPDRAMETDAGVIRGVCRAVQWGDRNG